MRKIQAYITRPFEQNNELDFYVFDCHEYKDDKYLGRYNFGLDSTNDKDALKEVKEFILDEFEIELKDETCIETDEYDVTLGFNE